MQQFSHYNNRRPGGGQDGRQTCNACRASVLQATVRKRAAKSSLQRLQSVRETLRSRHILRETWEAIAEHRKKQTRCARTSNEEATNEVATEKEIDQALQVPLATPQQELYVYTCPFCQGSYFVNCFRTHRPPTRVWETVSRAKWASPADAAYDPLFAHMPDLWDLRAKHQTIWANPKQTQTTQWPHVPYKRMARKLTTNHLLQYTDADFHWQLLPTGCCLLAAGLLAGC